MCVCIPYCSQTAGASASWLQLGEQTTGRLTHHQEFKGQLTGRGKKKAVARQTPRTVNTAARNAALSGETDWNNQSRVPRLSLSHALAFTPHVPVTSSARFLFPPLLTGFVLQHCIYDFLCNLGVSCTLMRAINQPLKRTVDSRRETWKIRGRPSPSSERPFKSPPESFKNRDLLEILANTGRWEVWQPCSTCRWRYGKPSVSSLLCDITLDRRSHTHIGNGNHLYFFFPLIWRKAPQCGVSFCSTASFVSELGPSRFAECLLEIRKELWGD